MPRARIQRGANGLRTPNPPRKRPRFIQKAPVPPFHFRGLLLFLALFMGLLLLLATC